MPLLDLMGYEFESMRVYLFAAIISFLWIVTITALAIRWIRQSLPRIKMMTAWNWAELSGWLLIISALTIYDSYLIFYR